MKKFRKYLLIISLPVVIYLLLGYLLRATGILHPYWGRYIVLGAKDSEGYARELADDPWFFRPIYEIERWLDWRRGSRYSELSTTKVHDDVEVYGTLTTAEIANTFQRSFRVPPPPSLRALASHYKDREYLDIMDRDMVLACAPDKSHAIKDYLVSIMLRKSLLRYRYPEEDIQQFYFRTTSKDVIVLGHSFPAGSFSSGMSEVDFGCHNSSYILVSPDFQRIAVGWRIND